MATVTLKPAAGRRVLNHQRQYMPLATDGEPVELDAVWRKRLDEGDAVVVPAAAEAAEDAPPPRKSKQ